MLFLLLLRYLRASYFVYIYIICYCSLQVALRRVSQPAILDPRSTFCIEELATWPWVRLQTVDWIMGRDRLKWWPMQVHFCEDG